MKILKYFLLFSIITCLIGCGKGTKVDTKPIDTINGKYVYITYSLDKEYTIGLDNNFVSKEYFLESSLKIISNVVPLFEHLIFVARTSASSEFIPIQIILTLFFNL